MELLRIAPVASFELAGRNQGGLHRDLSQALRFAEFHSETAAELNSNYM